MIAIAQKRYPHCTFIAGSSTPLPFEDKSVDVITVSCAFHHFENPQLFAKECHRVLKDKGILMMAEPQFAFLIRWIANYLIFPFSHSGDVKVYDAKELQEFFKTAGFTNIMTDIKDTILLMRAQK